MARPRIKVSIARRLYQQGASDPEIAREAGVGRRGVCYWRRREGLPALRRQGGRSGIRPLSAADEAKVARMLRQRIPSRVIAQAFGVSEATIDYRRRAALAAEGLGR